MKAKTLTLLATAIGFSLLSVVADAAPREKAANTAAHARDASHRPQPPRPAGNVHREVTRSAENGTRTVTVQGTTGDGRTWSRQDVRQRTENGHTRQITGTTPDGRSYEHNASVVRDREAGTWQRHVEGITPAGKAYSHDASVVHDRVAGTWTRTVDGITPNGKTYSIDASRQRTEDGFTAERTKITPAGVTIHDKVVAIRDENGTLHKDVTRDVTPPQNAGNAGE